MPTSAAAFYSHPALCICTRSAPCELPNLQRGSAAGPEGRTVVFV